MTFRYRRRYCGPLRAAILDWAGTVVDFGCLAPVASFVTAFAETGVEITLAEARAPMGRAKWQHIRAIADMPRVAAAWAERHGAPATDADIDRLYASFLPLQTRVVAEHADLVPGTLDAVAALRRRGLKIGSTTGYPRSVVAVVAERARQQGYAPDGIVAAEDTPRGRPSPFPALKALIDLDVFPVEAVVKIGDTAVDVEEGLNGGMWTIAVAVSGNEVGLGLADWQALPAADQAQRREAAAARLAAAGAHYVVDTIADVPPIIDAIGERLAAGEKP